MAAPNRVQVVRVYVGERRKGSSFVIINLEGQMSLSKKIGCASQSCDRASDRLNRGNFPRKRKSWQSHSTLEFHLRLRKVRNPSFLYTSTGTS